MHSPRWLYTWSEVSPIELEFRRPITNGLPDDFKQKLLGSIPLKRFGTADDVAAAVAFLAGDDAGYITADVLDVNGGMYM